MEHSVKIARNVATPLCIRGSHRDRRFFKPALRFLFPAPGPVAACFAREGTLSKKAPFPSALLGVERMPPDSDAKSRSAGLAPSASRAAPAALFLLAAASFLRAGDGAASPGGTKSGVISPCVPPARSLSPVLHPFSSRCKKPARQVFSDRPGWFFVLFHLLRAPPCGDAVWINAAADSAPRNRRRSPRRWAALIRRGSCPGCACRRYVRPPYCPPPGAGRPTAPARRWR